MVNDILKEAHTLKREIHPRIHMEIEGVQKIRWVTLSKSCFEKEITQFINSMNLVLKDHQICFEVIKSTAPNIGSFLFNNFDKQPSNYQKCLSNCLICENDARGDRKCIVSSVTKKKYHINPNIECTHSGIYGMTCKCVGQYGGKTTVTNTLRHKQHWTKNTSVKEHLSSCPSKPTIGDVKVQFLENVWDRGKYSLSEREFLWNKRLKGTINIQKVLSA